MEQTQVLTHTHKRRGTHTSTDTGTHTSAHTITDAATCFEQQHVVQVKQLLFLNKQPTVQAQSTIFTPNLVFHSHVSHC